MKLLVAILLLTKSAWCSEKLFNAVNAEFKITDTALMLYQSKKATTSSKLNITEAEKKEFEVKLGSEFTTKIKSEFTPSEIEYLEKWHNHPLNEKFRQFTKRMLREESIKTLDNIIALRGQQEMKSNAKPSK